MTGPARHAVLALFVALPCAAAVVACTAGDEVLYSGATDGTHPDGGTDGPSVADSSFEVSTRADDGGVLAQLHTDPCAVLDADGGCDMTAGKGCCLAASSATGSVSDNTCAEQVQYFDRTTYCRAANDVFLACASSDPDSTCCWQDVPADNGGVAHHTRYRASCAGGLEACNPVGRDGGPTGCNNGLPCVPAANGGKCKGIDIGACGQVPPCTE
ncbi:MAG: hypothetical protein JWP87_2700 [Labilithrix sp.]|nr:hypothetical protein [Labilithrix sp.]